jgi:hypothetical protein
VGLFFSAPTRRASRNPNPKLKSCRRARLVDCHLFFPLAVATEILTAVVSGRGGGSTRFRLESETEDGVESDYHLAVASGYGSRNQVSSATTPYLTGSVQTIGKVEMPRPHDAAISITVTAGFRICTRY